MKKGLCMAAFLILMTALCGVTSAYFIYGRDLQNSMTVGGNTIEITEDYAPPAELVMGNNTFKKRVRVKNTGSVPCFVRVFAEFSSSKVRDISLISPDGKQYFPAAEYIEHLPAGWEYRDLEDELLGPYYYYTEVLYPGESTPMLFDSIKTIIDDAGKIQDFEIIIYAESVQSRDVNGNEPDPADAWEDAWLEFLQRR